MNNKTKALVLTILFTIIVLTITYYYGPLGTIISLLGIFMFTIVYNVILYFIKD